MQLSELQNKKLVNIENGKNIGNIVDIKIDPNDGNVTSVIIENQNRFFLLGHDEEKEVSWKNIKKIGEDVILIDLKK